MYRRTVLQNGRILHSLPFTGKTSFAENVRQEYAADVFEPEVIAEEMGFLDGCPPRFLLTRQHEPDKAHNRRVILSELGLITKMWMMAYPRGIVITALYDDPFRSLVWPNGRITLSVGYVNPAILVERSKKGITPELAIKVIARWMELDFIEKRVSLEADEFLADVVELPFLKQGTSRSPAQSEQKRGTH